MRGVAILGSTGSIGINTLDVIASNSDQFKVIALAAQRNIKTLFEQCLAFKPEYAVLVNESAAQELKDKIKAANLSIKVLSGSKALNEICCLPQTDLVMSAIVGAAGLSPTLAAIEHQKTLLLANKEALVMAGDLFINKVKHSHSVLLPIDSEHNAIFQCLPSDFKCGTTPAGVKRIILTASGGSFRDTPLSDLDKVTPEQACKHPNWNMGKKITVDSATMMNKALEVIEAHYLFNFDPAQIETLLHPQSIVHSLVEYIDGSILAQLGNPDMRTPIAHALAWPKRIKSGVASLDFIAKNRLDFIPMDFKRYPCLQLAYDVLQTKGTAPAILNAANEVAVQSFLDNQLAFSNIFTIIAKVLDKLPARKASDLEVILEDDNKARELATRLIMQ